MTESMSRIHPLLAQRRAGVLLHPTSLPGSGPVGRLGAAAEAWIDGLAESGFTLWQTLPLCPPDSLGSPYQSCSVFAGDERLIDPERLPGLTGEPVVDSGLTPAQWDAVHHALMADGHLHARFEAFCAAERHWLEDFALYQAIKAREGAPWHAWPEPLRDRDAVALEQAASELAASMVRTRTAQFFFDAQWRALRQRAHERGVLLFGDLPIFVAHDSADVWAHQHLFTLDSAGHPTEVTGVPPDLFSKTGQLWGNPCYRWDVLAADGYRWWIDRFGRVFALTDIARVDHFRAFQAGWQVPASAETAMHGRWVPGPGRKLFDAVRAKLGEIAIIVEDLGIITPDVHALRADLGYPGMKVLQFAFGGASDNPYLPHNYEPHCVVYTGTHDNDTTRHWYATGSEEQKDHVRRYLGRDGSDVVWDLIRLALSSVAVMAVIPLQDVLELDGDARMNFPGTPYGNWQWRFQEGMLTREHAARLLSLSELYGRVPMEEQDGRDGA